MSMIEEKSLSLTFKLMFFYRFEKLNFLVEYFGRILFFVMFPNNFLKIRE